MQWLRVRYAPVILVILGLAFAGTSQMYGLPGVGAAGGTTYHLDCANGNDNHNGTSPSSAWKSLGRANNAKLAPGDSLLLKRGCSWSGQLKAKWDGNASNPIVIGAYGNGDLPVVKNATNGQVKITGSYQVVENLKMGMDAKAYPSNADCGDQPLGWVIGVNIPGGHHNTVRNSVMTGQAAGVAFTDSAHHNRILNNRIVDNYGAWKVSSKQGGTGMLLRGSSNEVAYNHFENNAARCWDESISIEVFNAINSNVHHNTVRGDKVFAEMGSGKIDAADNTFAYNVVSTNKSRARFMVTRGAPHQFGPVLRTTLFNNSVYYTAGNSVGVVCEACSTNILTMKNNIIVAGEKGLWVGKGQSLNESNNIFWPTNGVKPNNFIQNHTLAKTSKIADPKFMNPGSGDLRIKDTSPALQAGSGASVQAGYTKDIFQTSVPQGPAVDIGVHERGGAAAQSEVPDSGSDPVDNPKDPAIPALVSLPGRFEAEDYRKGGEGTGYHDSTPANLGGAYRDDAVDIQITNDGAGFNVGWPEADEWLAYDIDAQGGDYVFTFRVASIYNNQRFHVQIDGQNVTGSIVVPNTGDWHAWSSVSSDRVSISAGTHTLKIVSETSGYNLNWVEASVADSVAASNVEGVEGAEDSIAAAIALPGRIEAEDYRAGGSGVGFNDTTPENLGGAYRDDAVDIKETEGGDGGHLVGWPDAGEWLAYDVTINEPGTYVFSAQVASTYQDRAFHIEIDDANVTGSMVVPNTGGWQAWELTSSPAVELEAGSHTLKVVAETDGYNIDYIDVAPAAQQVQQMSVATAEQSVTTPITMHVSDLDVSTDSDGTSATPAVQVSVHDESHNPAANVTVVGTWSDAGAQEFSCTTDETGSCVITIGVDAQPGAFTFSVTNLKHAELVYDQTANHVPEGADADNDVSDGTSVAVNVKP